MKPWIGCEIRLLRSQLGWKRVQLAKYLGCSPLKVVKMESDEIIPFSHEKEKLRNLESQIENGLESFLREFGVDNQGMID